MMNSFPANSSINQEFFHMQIIKPLMEKKRRDRIARSLNQLKVLLLGDTNQGNKPLPHSRMDKAALLEMTVRRIQMLQVAVAEDRGFQTGYSYCASLVRAFFISERQRYLEAPTPSNPAAKPTCEAISLATLPSASTLLKISRWSDMHLASHSLRHFERSVPSVILSRTGSQVFWRPWST
ncbi:transcription factor HES-7.1-B-like [Varanus komodoensis]|uniref:transcription factor HES-7.1-B-like n=1 Tax=Varanus komodoensis TaxID=61221 RepID=UPI001CF7C7E3|nr:transcription factor HES-7.1-B-like [Varanus komodoensis]